ncbi:MAG: PfkB family carbohydrate kinase [Vicinamibacterales bacterium]
MSLTTASIHPRPGDHELETRLLGLVDGFRDRRIVVVGDLVADEFIYGRLSRVSREAPVLILEYDRTTVVPGGAGNAAANVASLGGAARLVGVLGHKEIDRRLLRALPHGVDRTGIVRARAYLTPVKTRILAGGLHSARQQIVRIDRHASPGDTHPALGRVERAARVALDGCDAVLVSDYGSGLVTPQLVAGLKRRLAKRGRRREIPILVDSRHDLLRYRGLTACTPNESEAEEMLEMSIGDDPRRIQKAGREIMRRTGADGVVLTRGSRGMAVFVSGQRTAHIPISGTDEVADVTGAGDTVIATLTLALAVGASLYEAARLANCAGGVVVMKRGTATVSADELRHAVTNDLAH